MDKNVEIYRVCISCMHSVMRNAFNVVRVANIVRMSHEGIDCYHNGVMGDVLLLVVYVKGGTLAVTQEGILLGGDIP